MAELLHLEVVELAEVTVVYNSLNSTLHLVEFVLGVAVLWVASLSAESLLRVSESLLESSLLRIAAKPLLGIALLRESALLRKSALVEALLRKSSETLLGVSAEPLLRESALVRESPLLRIAALLRKASLLRELSLLVGKSSLLRVTLIRESLLGESLSLRVSSLLVW